MKIRPVAAELFHADRQTDKHEEANFYVLLTVHPNTMIVFFTNLMHKFFILICLLHSSTCFEHYCAHLQEDKLY